MDQVKDFPAVCRRVPRGETTERLPGRKLEPGFGLRHRGNQSYESGRKFGKGGA